MDKETVEKLYREQCERDRCLVEKIRLLGREEKFEEINSIKVEEEKNSGKEHLTRMAVSVLGVERCHEIHREIFGE